MRRLLFVLSIFITVQASAQRGGGGENLLNNIKGNPNQNKAQSDSSSKRKSKLEKNRDNSVVINYTTFQSIAKKEPTHNIDTIHQHYGHYTHQDLGNVGSSVFPLVQSIEWNAGQLLNRSSWSVYTPSIDEVPFYNTNKPYSRLHLRAGRKQESAGEILFARNKDSLNGFSFLYRKHGAPGYYKMQRNTQDFMQAAIILKPHRKWFMRAAGQVYQVRQDEHGGILEIDSLASPNYSVRQIIPVYFGNELAGKRSPVRNYVRQNDVKIQNTFTMSERWKLPQLVHQFILRDELYRLDDKKPDEIDYSLWNNSLAFTGIDTLLIKQRLLTIQNEFGSAQKIGKGKLEGYYGIEAQRYTPDTSAAVGLFNNYIKASWEQPLRSWNLVSNGQFYLVGNNAGSYHVNARISKSIRNLQLNASLMQTLSPAPLAWRNVRSNFYAQEYEVTKQLGTQIGGGISWLKDSNTFLRAQFTNATWLNYIYIDSNLSVKNSDQFISIPRMEISFATRLSRFGVYGMTTTQFIGANDPINAPSFIGKFGLNYHNVLYKTLHFVTGVEARSFSSFNTPEYTWQYGQYRYARSFRQNNLPEVTAYLNARLKNFRIYLMASELLQPITSNRILLKDHAAQDLYMRVGIIWTMID